ncbi:hypothetical protein VTI28DRAFT_2907 [Corynascus sepedonium]
MELLTTTQSPLYPQAVYKYLIKYTGFIIIQGRSWGGCARIARSSFAIEALARCHETRWFAARALQPFFLASAWRGPPPRWISARALHPISPSAGRTVLGNPAKPAGDSGEFQGTRALFLVCTCQSKWLMPSRLHQQQQPLLSRLFWLLCSFAPQTSPWDAIKILNELRPTQEVFARPQRVRISTIAPE